MTSPKPRDSTIDAAGRALADWAARQYFYRAYVASEAVPEGELVYWKPEAIR